MLAEGTVTAGLSAGIGYSIPDFPGGNFSVTATSSTSKELPECENKFLSACITVGAEGVVAVGYGLAVDVSYTINIFQDVNAASLAGSFGWMGTVEARLDFYIKGKISGSFVLKRYRL